MFKSLRTCFLIIFIISITSTVVHSESKWITKKSEKTYQEKIKKTEYIKKKKKEIKKNKQEYKKEEKKISKEVKTWITKKIKEKYINSIDKLPDGAIYFSGVNKSFDLNIYGYVIPDSESKLISNYYETSTGFGYFDDGKTICKIGSTILNVLDGEVTARISGKCNNGIKFTGKTSQTLNSGWGSAKTSDGNDRINFDFSSDKKIIANLFNENKKIQIAALPSKRQSIKDTNIKPTGEYYALLIGNSKYVKWTSLTSPTNDVTEIAQVLKQKYKFKKVITVVDADRKKIFKAFNELSKLTTDNDYVLIYYSGHGDIRSNQSYWIPIDAEKEFGMGDWINIKDIEVYLEKEIPAHHLALMVDSCYFSGFKGLNKITEDNKSKVFKKLLDRRARIVLASGSNEPVEDSGQNKHSIFGLSFIQALKNNDDVINLASIGLQIAYAHAGMNQQPYLHNPPTWGHLGGDFLFISKK